MIRLRLPELPFRGVPGGVFFLPGCPGGRPSEGRKCPDGAPEGPAGDTPAGVPCAPKCSAGRCVKEARGSVAPPSAQHVVFCGRRGRAALRVEAPGPLRCAQHAVFYGILVRSSALYGHMPHVARQKTRGALRCTPKPRACCFLLRESSLPAEGVVF